MPAPRLLPCAVVLCGAVLCPAVTAGAAEQPPNYTDHVLPIFREKCGGCHNADKREGGLDLMSHGQSLAGGSSGEVIVPGDPDASHLWQVASHAAEPKMPPESDRIPAEMLEVIRTWIAGGAIERAGGRAAKKKKTSSVTLDPSAAAAPDGPPVMPPRLSLEVATHGRRALAVTGLAASPNGPLLAVGGRRQVMLFDASTLGFLGVLPFPEGDVKTIRFSRNARLLLAGGGAAAKSGRVVVWDVATAKRLAELGDEFDQVLAADITADQRIVALGGPQKVVRLVQTADGTVDAEIRKHTDWITALEFSPDGALLATGDRAGNAFLWETRGAREDAVLKGHGGGITAVAWRGDGGVVATASEDGRIRLWAAKNGEKAKEWEAHPGGVQGLCWLADGRLASCGRDRKVAVWKGDGTRERSVGPADEIMLRVAVTSDQSRLVAGDLGGHVPAFAIADGHELGEIDANPPRLADRLVAAEKLVAERRAAEREAGDRAKLAADAAVADDADATARKAADEATAAVAVAREQLAAALADVDRWRQEIAHDAGTSDPAAK
jgi:dipeptidyl aminopeptidase/acylaminoacyl peptidase